MSEKSATATLSKTLGDNPATQRLKDEAGRYAHAMVGHVAKTATQKVTDLAGHLDGISEGGSIGGDTLKKMAGGKSPVQAAGSAVTGKIGDSVKSMFGKGKKKGGSTKTVNIVEEIDIGLPRSTVYNQWTQFADFTQITKGVQSADQNDETTVEWRAKIFWSSRSWTSNITDQVPDQRIAWTSKGAKGSVDGVVTFHELTPDLTKVLLDLRYHPQGLFEKTGNIWRAQGRRARLDLKKFRQHIMAQAEESGAWRGEIRDGEVVDSGEDQDEQGQQGQQGDRNEQGEESKQRGRSEQRDQDQQDEQGKQSDDEGEQSEGGSDRQSSRRGDKQASRRSSSDKSESGRSDSRRPKSREGNGESRPQSREGDGESRQRSSRRRPARAEQREEQG